ncbi:MAG: methylated-DNA--[protein]-cysteine S-methyltransferase [Thermoanaerobaculia bacterium]
MLDQETVAPAPSVLRVLFPSALGPLGIELRGQTITRLVIEPEGEEAATYTPFAEIDGSDFLDEVFGRLSEYFAGARRSLDLRWDLRPSRLPRFDARILQEVAKIPYGRTRTYQRIATSAGQPDGYRQVLSVLLANPIPVIIPCHRVVTNKSGPGSYIGGQERKRWLLELERSSVEDAS